MSYQIEFEERLMLEEEEYNKLLPLFENQEKLDITNIYFDTPSFDIRKSKMMLRIRKTNNDPMELTLKIKGSNGDEEYTQNINDESIPNEGIVIDKLHSRNINVGQIAKWGSIRVIRYELRIEDDILVLDSNYYGDIKDYNLEVESTSMENAKNRINAVISQYNLEIKKNDYLSKSSRAYKYFINN